jgi:hypothetical protein
MRCRASSLELAVVWSDADFQEVVISASSPNFFGRVNLYASPGELAQLADRLSGFPTSRYDRREFQLGQDNLFGYGTAKISLYSSDSTGHVIFELDLKANADTDKVAQQVESCLVLVSGAVADVDRLEAELRAIDNVVGSSTVVRSAG